MSENDMPDAARIRHLIAVHDPKAAEFGSPSSLTVEQLIKLHRTTPPSPPEQRPLFAERPSDRPRSGAGHFVRRAGL